MKKGKEIYLNGKLVKFGLENKAIRSLKKNWSPNEFPLSATLFKLVLSTYFPCPIQLLEDGYKVMVSPGEEVTLVLSCEA